MILCGSGAARHLCQLINQPLPPAFNPFIGDEECKNRNIKKDKNNSERDNTVCNPLRRKLYYAVQLFITRYQETLKPGTKIFKIRESLCDEKNIEIIPHYLL